MFQRKTSLPLLVLLIFILGGLVLPAQNVFAGAGAICTQTPFYTETFTSGNGSYAGQVVQGSVGAAWVFQNSNGYNGSANSWFDPDIASVSQSRLSSPDIVVPAGAANIYVKFAHLYNLESTFDGGQLQLGVSGSFTTVANAAFTENGYNGTISSNFLSPIGGQAAFTGSSTSYITSTANLTSVSAGQTIKIGFLTSTDQSVSAIGWRIGYVEVGSCLGQAPAITSAATATIVAGVPFSHTFTATGNPSPTFSYSAENLPPGVTRSGNTLSGTPTATGEYTITATAANGISPDAVQTFAIKVTGDAPVITSPALEYGVFGVPFGHTFTAAGNPAPTLSYSAENLPPGITLVGDTLSGTPTIGGTYGLTVTASNGLSPVAVQTFVLIVEGLPMPPPTPLCEDHNFSDDGVVRSSTSDAMGYALNCRVLYQNGAPTQWLGGDLYSSGSIGVEGIVDLGIQQAIDIFSPAGVNYFQGGGVFCLRGSGTLIWLAASGMPRHAEIIGSYTVPDFPGFTCATLFEPGTLVLVSQDPLNRSAAPEVPAAPDASGK